MTENKGDLISREALKKAIRQRQWHIDDIEEVMKIIDNAPTVTPDKIQAIMSDYLVYRCEPQRPQGEWIFNNKWQDYECNKCHAWTRKRQGELPNFCSNCGADMRGKEE